MARLSISRTAGDFNGDGFTDIALVHQLPDNGADVHLLWGATTPFANPQTFVRHLDATAGWQWSQLKPVTPND